MMGTANIITVEKLSCKVGKKFLLKDINWEINAGENWVLYGMNGSGKTTLLSIIAGFQHFSSGKVTLLGEEFNQDNGLAMRKKIGFVSSSFFDKHYTKEAVLDIVLSGKFGTLSLGEDLDLEDIKLAKALLKELHLADKINSGFDMLSKGERQNVMIARALFAKPDILVLDEPCNGLDAYNRAHLFRTIADLAHKKQMTVIYVTHYVEEIYSDIFNKALLLKNGRVFAQGNLAEVITEENISALLDYDIKLEKNFAEQMTIDIELQSKIVDLL